MSAKHKNPISGKHIIRNRRYKKLQELINEGEYFSESSIKMRHPLLFHMYIGRYERNGDFKPNSLMMTDLCFQRIDEQNYSKEFEKIMDKEG